MPFGSARNRWEMLPRKSLPTTRSQVACENARATLRQAASENENPRKSFSNLQSLLTMKKSVSKSAFLSPIVLISLGAISAAVFMAVFATSAQTKRPQKAGNSRSPRGVVQEEWVARYNRGHGF